MNRDIAAFLSSNGEFGSLFEPGALVIYHKVKNKWIVIRRMPFTFEQSRGLPGLRRHINTALDFMGECRYFAALSVSGLPYFELEKAGVTVWEALGKPEDILDFILAEVEASNHEERTSNSPENFAPIEVSPGHYRISLQEIQEQNVSLTSKQVLMPFLDRQRFDTLEVVCSHMPPWLEIKLMNKELRGDVTRTATGAIKITLLGAVELKKEG